MTAYGDYRVVRVLGQGGMGVVYEAEHGALGRRVALKVLAEHAMRDPIALARLRREALSMGALQHPHVVQVSDFSAGPPPFLVMELLVGQSLRERLRATGPMKPDDACAIAVQLLSALGAAHRAGIVHRDVKPANVFVVETPLTKVFVKLLDFGVAKLLTPQSGPALTSFDEVLGSAPYMAPEQIRGEDIDGRTDIFAVGVTLYEMLAGRRPFVAAPNENVLLSILRGGPIAPLDVPRGLEAVVLRALQRAPTARYLTAEEMAAALMPFVPQASLGAVATSAMESRAPHLQSALGETAATATNTLSPPTLAATVDQTARSDGAKPYPSPAAPSWGVPAAPAPPYYPGAPASPTPAPTRHAGLWIALVLLLVPFLAAVVIRVITTGAGALSGIGSPGVPGITGGRAPHSGSCMHRFPNGRPNICQDFFLPANSPVSMTDFCDDTDGATRSATKCDRTGAKFGCDSGTVQIWSYASSADPRTSCPAPAVLLTP